MTTPEHVKQSPKQKIKAPRAAAPAAACVAGRSTGQHMPPQQALKTNGNSAPHKTKKTKRALILVASLQRRDGAESTLLRPRAGGGLNSLNPKPQPPISSCRHSVAACVSDHSCGQDLPPANPLRTNGNTALPIKLKPMSFPSSEHVKQSPKQKIKAPRAAAPAAACVAGRSTGQHMPPQQALKTNGNSAPHKTKKTKRALILVASLQRRDGAESTLLRPRAGGGLNPFNPKPQPPISSCRHSVAACVSDHSCGQDLPPANPLRTNGNAALPIKLKPMSFPSSEHVKQSPKQKIKAPRAAAPAAACVAGRSTGQHMLPQQPSKQTATAPPHKTKKTKSALILVASLQRRDGAEWTLLRPLRAAD